MPFKNREEVGHKLASALAKYRSKKIVFFALPRGGVPIASILADAFKAPLYLVLTRKIGHPLQPEYAVAAVSEKGYLVCNKQELETIDPLWFSLEKQKQIEEIKRRRLSYPEIEIPSFLDDTLAIIVDDGIATGLTMEAAIMDIHSRNPQKVLVATAVCPLEKAKAFEDLGVKVVSLLTPPSKDFLGAVSAYYEDFPQVEEKEVLSLLKTHLKKAS